MSDQVICIRDDWTSDYEMTQTPVRGQVYTVTGLYTPAHAGGRRFYALYEMPPHPTQPGPTVWFVDCFRKCRPTDISCFKTKAREREDA